MRAVVVTHSSTYESRAEAAGEFFQQKGCETTWICSDFDHLRKKTVKREKDHHVYLHMRPYASNLSVRRLLSIRDFSLEVEKYLEDLYAAGKGPDLLYVLIPANTLAAAAGRLHAKYGVRVIFDLIDLWPESLPLKRVASLPPVVYWRNLRDDNLDAADMICTECAMYQRELHLNPEKSRTLYWFKDSASPQNAGCQEVADESGTLGIAYMGAVNHIIDIPLIVSILLAVNSRTKVCLHVIGEGDRKAGFVKALCEAGIPFADHGAVYAEREKAAILSGCRFGINVMKESVHVGLTMKSIDYLSFGLPLINTIGGDTWDFVEKCGIGVNVDRRCIDRGAEDILRLADTDRQILSAKARAVYQAHFTRASFDHTLEECYGAWTDASGG